MEYRALGCCFLAGYASDLCGKPVFIIHGDGDIPNTRFFPVRDALLSAGAILEDTLMPGVGHTIDFAGRNALLGKAYRWVDSVNCAQLGTGSRGIQDEGLNWALEVYPTAVLSGEQIRLTWDATLLNPEISVFNLQNGAEVAASIEWSPGTARVAVTDPLPGAYLIRLSTSSGQAVRKVLLY